MRILVADEDAALAAGLRQTLHEHGFVVDVLHDVAAIETTVAAQPFDAILLNSALQGRPAFELCRDARERGVNAAIIMMSARPRVGECVASLDSGADDYVASRIARAELLARLRALLRRRPGAGALPEPGLPVSEEAPVRLLDLVFEPAAHVCRRGDRQVSVTPKEEAIVGFLIHHAGELVARAALIAHVWPEDDRGVGNVLDVYISRIRRKIDGPGEVPLVHTVRGRGFRFGPAGPLRLAVTRRGTGAGSRTRYLESVKDGGEEAARRSSPSTGTPAWSDGVG